MRNVIRLLIWKYFIRLTIKYIVGIQYGSNKSILESKQFILVGNHNSHLDTATILSALPKNAFPNTYPIAAADYFGRNKLTTFLSTYFLNASLILRQKGDPDSINPITQMDKLLKEGKSLILFPEGSRGAPEEMQKFKAGVGVLLRKNPHIPFIPMYLNGMGRALPKGDGLLVPFNGSIQFGEAELIEKDMSVEEIVEKIEKAVLKLSKS